MYTIDSQWTHSQQHSEAVTAWDRYSYRNTSATKPFITNQKAACPMFTIDNQRTHSQQNSVAVMVWDRYSYRNTRATKPLLPKEKAAREFTQ